VGCEVYKINFKSPEYEMEFTCILAGYKLDLL